jgi:dipeptidyl aminopeptidase/acylaminoacyl peptidase
MLERPPLRDYSRSRAVLVGTWDFVYLNPVPAASNSLNRMRSMLTGPLCGWPEDRIRVLANERGPGDLPDRLITSFEDITGVALFYYVGHGQVADGNQLCLGLTESRTEANRRASTSLPFQAVRKAMLESEAATKIVILDCCFAGLASQSAANTLGANADDVADMTAVSGTYTMAASGDYALASYETDPEIERPQTYFTKYLVDLVEAGIPGRPSDLRLHQIFVQLRDNLDNDGRPVPYERSVDAAREFIFAHNAAPLETHRDPDTELRQLRQLLEQRARELDEAGEREQALRAEMAERTLELERLYEEAQHTSSMAAEQQQELRDAIEVAERRLDETSAAQAAAEAELSGPAVTAEAELSGPTATAEPGEPEILEGGDEESPEPSPAEPAPAGAGGEVVPGPRRAAARRGPARAGVLARRIPLRLWVLAAGLTAGVLLAVFLVPGSHSSPPPSPPAHLVATIGNFSPYTSDIDNNVAFNRAGTTLAITDNVGEIALWDLATRKITTILTDPGANVLDGGVAFSPDGTTLAVGDAGGDVYLWDVSRRKITGSLSGPETIGNGVANVAFSPGGGTLAGNSLGPTTYLWNVTTHKITRTFLNPDEGSKCGLVGLAISPDGKTLAAGDCNGSTYLWDVRTGTLITTLMDPTGSPPGAWGNDMAFSPDGATLAVADNNTSTYLWNVNTHRLITTLANPAPVIGSPDSDSLAFGPDGSVLAVGDSDGSSYVWNVDTRKVVATFTDPGGFGDVNSVAFSPDGKTLAAADNDGTTYVWNTSWLHL